MASIHSGIAVYLPFYMESVPEESRPGEFMHCGIPGSSCGHIGGTADDDQGDDRTILTVFLSVHDSDPDTK